MVTDSNTMGFSWQLWLDVLGLRLSVLMNAVFPDCLEGHIRNFLKNKPPTGLKDVRFRIGWSKAKATLTFMSVPIHVNATSQDWLEENYLNLAEMSTCTQDWTDYNLMVRCLQPVVNYDNYFKLNIFLFLALCSIVLLSNVMHQPPRQIPGMSNILGNNWFWSENSLSLQQWKTCALVLRRLQLAEVWEGDDALCGGGIIPPVQVDLFNGSDSVCI